MTNVHTPQRLDDESFDAYKARRIMSKRRNAAMNSFRSTGPFKQRVASIQKLARRDTVKAIGRRQARRAMRDVLGRH